MAGGGIYNKSFRQRKPPPNPRKLNRDDSPKSSTLALFENEPPRRLEMSRRGGASLPLYAHSVLVNPQHESVYPPLFKKVLFLGETFIFTPLWTAHFTFRTRPAHVHTYFKRTCTRIEILQSQGAPESTSSYSAPRSLTSRSRSDGVHATRASKEMRWLTSRRR